MIDNDIAKCLACCPDLDLMQKAVTSVIDMKDENIKLKAELGIATEGLILAEMQNKGMLKELQEHDPEFDGKFHFDYCKSMMPHKHEAAWEQMICIVDGEWRICKNPEFHTHDGLVIVLGKKKDSKGRV